MERKDYVDYIKAVGIILVILGHINFANELVKTWIYSFHMPLFFFATGLTIRKQSINGQLLTKKVKCLLVPYFVWGFIYAQYSFGNVAKIVYGSYQSITSAGSLTSLWFLPTMFLAVVIVLLILQMSSNKAVLSLCAMVIFIVALYLPHIDWGYPWCFDASLIAVVFIIIGYLFENWVVPIFEKVGEWIWGLIIIAGFAFSMTYRLNPLSLDSYVLLAERRLGNPIFWVIPAIGGSMMVYGLLRIAGGVSMLDKPFSFIGRNTLIIFVVHKLVIAIFEKAFTVLEMPYLIELILSGCGVLLCSCAACFVINKLAPCLAGK